MKTIQGKLEKQKQTRWLNETRQCREIVQEILSFGVNQDQIKNVIKLLALELEDVEIMKAISQILIENVNEQVTTVNILKPGGKTDE